MPGVPKGVELTHQNIIVDIQSARLLHEQSNVQYYYNLRQVYQQQIATNPPQAKHIVNMNTHNVSLCFLPWSHVFGLTCELNMLQSSGGCMAIVPHRDMILTCLNEVTYGYGYEYGHGFGYGYGFEYENGFVGIDYGYCKYIIIY
ncbi:hypothetical protein EON65_05295 [archaeon]|nr:MAG: hypothetical protein EON65_05295 [archaeon]